MVLQRTWAIGITPRQHCLWEQMVGLDPEVSFTTSALFARSGPKPRSEEFTAMTFRVKQWWIFNKSLRDAAKVV